MKSLLIPMVAAMTVCSVPVGGLLQQMQKKIISMGCIEISVSMQDYNVSVVSDGNRYHLSSDAMEVWCDGTHQWIYNSENNELTITSFDAGAVDIFENPAAILTSDITRTYNIVSEHDGQIVLKAGKNVRTSYPGLSIKIGSTGLPQSITLTSAAGETYLIKVNSVKSIPDASSVSFVPSQALSGKAFVNDLR